MYATAPLAEFAIGSRVNATRLQLNALSDETLYDIGIARGQIDEVARGLAARVSAPVRRHLVERALSIAPLFRAYRTV